MYPAGIKPSGQRLAELSGYEPNELRIVNPMIGALPQDLGDVLPDLG